LEKSSEISIHILVKINPSNQSNCGCFVGYQIGVSLCIITLHRCSLIINSRCLF